LRCWEKTALAKQRSFDERTIPGEVLWMQQLHARGYLQVVEILRHAVLNRELWSDDYVVLLEWMAQSHPDLQEAACTTIAELAITQAPSTAQSSVAVFSHVSESRRQSERLQNLLGLPPPQLGNGALGSEPTRPARMSELRRIFERVIDPLPERKDFTIRFVLSATLEIMCQAMQDDIWPFIQNWCEPKRIFTKRTLALSVLPAFGMRRRVVDQIKELFISDHEPQFWVRRSAAEAMVELLRQKKKPVNVSDEMHADEVFNEFNAVLSARINQIPNDALSTIERAMLLENQIYLHAAVHRPPRDTHEHVYARGRVWPEHDLVPLGLREHQTHLDVGAGRTFATFHEQANPRSPTRHRGLPRQTQTNRRRYTCNGDDVPRLDLALDGHQERIVARPAP
jgi:hypothetical protein